MPLSSTFRFYGQVSTLRLMSGERLTNIYTICGKHQIETWLVEKCGSINLGLGTTRATWMQVYGRFIKEIMCHSSNTLQKFLKKLWTFLCSFLFLFFFSYRNTNSIYHLYWMAKVPIVKMTYATRKGTI